MISGEGSAIRLRARDVSFDYHLRPCLKKIGLDLLPGEILGVLGPNGSGKSTLLKTMFGHLKAREGEIELAGLSLESLTPRERARKVAFVPQNSGLRAPLTVFQAVLMGRYSRKGLRFGGYSGSDFRLTREVLRDLSLSEFIHRPVTELSGGEFQKVLLARAFVQEAPVLFLDEATSNLDIHHTLEIMEIVKNKVAREGLSVVSVMHDLNLAASWCDRIAIMKAGEVFVCGEPGQVITREIIREVYGVSLVVHHDQEGIPYVLPRVSAAREVSCA
ncbi:iron complex transport system ATP-binding protein [Alkalispirochaeta americana]|uniref:Iron complex transport system ATP-binding protein n=1 Tax=Alkalispirochaeta americana TaxID=159291 RepID=A0A1N6Q6E0_9SPIO|nr:ABC transporter ATP-binding protein [Alkalispirochaeta americana]SIQ12140.1 iron complex transport system ATP-binding protein [Alkalispirochaeta americana]